MPKVVYNRCTYVIEENERVLNSVEALKKSLLHKLGENMYSTHNGLQNLYEVSCPELDFLVNYSKKYDNILGARMMGGGFGGCTINIIHQDTIDSFIDEVSKAYYDKFNIKLTAFEVMPSEGTSIKMT